MQMTKPLNSILIKPAGPDCNMKCEYCFYLRKTRLFPNTFIHRMSETTLKQLIRQVMTYAGSEISFAWQGGEPTLMGLDFFKKAIDLQKQFGGNRQVGNGLQSNGILIDREWARFLKKYKFLVGLSLDGPARIHDKYRRMKGKKGNRNSWAKATDTAKLLLDTGVSVNAMCVVSNDSSRFPEEIYHFFKSLGLRYMQFIPCIEFDPHLPGKAAPFSVDSEQFGHFLIKVFELWINDFHQGRPTTSVRYFESVFFNYVGKPAPDCTLHQNCGVYIVVEHNGDVYSCDFFVDKKWKLGNIMEPGSENLLKMLNSPLQETFGSRKTDVSQSCLKCPWYAYCFGGCPKDRLVVDKTGRTNYLCQSYKMFFQHADAHLRELAARWTQESNHSLIDVV
jgi:uncharacterized protein